MGLNSLLTTSLSAISQGILWGIMALGVYISFRILDIADMSCEGSFASGACVLAVGLVNWQINPLLSIILAVIVGFLAGIITGLLCTKCKIPSILAGILTQLGLYSINLRIQGRSNLPLISTENIFTKFSDLTGLNSTLSSIIIGLIFTIAVIAIIYYFFGTQLGSCIRAVGNNKQMAAAQGINTDYMIIIGLAISNSLIALSGSLVAQSQGFSDVKIGQGAIVIGLAAIIIGEVLMPKKSNFVMKFSFVILGSIIYRLIVSIVLQLGLNTDDLKLFTAILVGLSLSLPTLLANKKTPGVKKN